MDCPICGKKIKEYGNDFMEHILMEEWATCRDENHFYNYSYSTGNYEEILGAVTFFYHHTMSPEEKELFDKQYKVVLELEKEHYQKKIKGVNL